MSFSVLMIKVISEPADQAKFRHSDTDFHSRRSEDFIGRSGFIFRNVPLRLNTINIQPNNGWKVFANDFSLKVVPLSGIFYPSVAPMKRQMDKKLATIRQNRSDFEQETLAN